MQMHQKIGFNHYYCTTTFFHAGIPENIGENPLKISVFRHYAVECHFSVYVFKTSLPRQMIMSF